MEQDKLRQLAESANLGLVHPDITEANFPEIGPRGQVSRIFSFPEPPSTAEVLEQMQAEGYRPATPYEMFEGAKDWNREGTVVALSIRPDRIDVVTMEGQNGRVTVSPRWENFGWGSDCRFPAVSIR